MSYLHGRGSMARKRIRQSEPCPHCGGTSVWSNGSSRGHRRWKCGDCKKSFGRTYATPLYRLRTPVDKIATALLVVMRRGSLSAAEEITGHKWETVRDWLLLAGEHADKLTEELVKGLELDEVEVDAFWSFIGNAVDALQTRHPRNRGWASQLRMQQTAPGRRGKSRVSAGGA
jgi:transposase-like protein